MINLIIEPNSIELPNCDVITPFYPHPFGGAKAYQATIHVTLIGAEENSFPRASAKIACEQMQSGDLMTRFVGIKSKPGALGLFEYVNEKRSYDKGQLFELNVQIKWSHESEHYEIDYSRTQSKETLCHLKHHVSHVTWNSCEGKVLSDVIPKETLHFWQRAQILRARMLQVEKNLGIFDQLSETIRTAAELFPYIDIVDGKSVTLFKEEAVPVSVPGRPGIAISAPRCAPS